jgi:thiosulfate/3-mercaptopyruvate sulfurtransferase
MSQLISAKDLKNSLVLNDLKIFDCRADLTDREQSRKLYDAGHIPGAVHAHLENDLSGPIIPGQTGRHPLPITEHFQDTLRNWGIHLNDSVVVYDQTNSMFAVRLWWMLRWAGLTDVKVLNGGLDAWLAAGGDLSQDSPSSVNPSDITPRTPSDWVVSQTDLYTISEQTVLLDARALNRYSGETEPLDAKAGHIPGAINADFTKNLNEDGTFKASAALAERFTQLRGKSVICYCGSGVTACHNAFAIVESGLPLPKLFPGSWSEWITNESNALATGIEGAL